MLFPVIHFTFKGIEDSLLQIPTIYISSILSLTAKFMKQLWRQVMYYSVTALFLFRCTPLLIQLHVEIHTLDYWLIEPIQLRRFFFIFLWNAKVWSTTAMSRRVNRGVFALLQHWLAACQCSVTWCHTDGHVSETQTTRRAASSSQQTHSDTQQRP